MAKLVLKLNRNLSLLLSWIERSPPNNEEKVKRKKNNIDVDKLVDSIKENPDLMEKLLEALK